MQVNDIIKNTIIFELGGVPMGTSLYWRVEDSTLNLSISSLLLEIAQAFAATIDALIADAGAWTCATWVNQQGNDPITQSFFVIPGANPGDALPTQDGVYVRRQSVIPFDTIGQLVSGSIFISGIAESNVDRGRLIDAGEMGNIESWLASDFAAPGNGTVLRPGFLINTTPPQIPVFVATQQATTVPNIRSQKRRQSRLCGT